MTVSLLFLMAYQVTGEVLHEWMGMGMTALVIVHQILNRKWYSAVFKGKYNPYRIMTTAVNILLLLSFAMTALSGMSMSGHAVPFMYGMVPASLARKMHLAMSHWSFVLMGLHIGLHIPVMTAKMKIEGKTKTAVTAVFCCIAGFGLFLFLHNGWADYMFFRAAFAFLDYEKAGVLVFLENMLMLIFWAFIGDQAVVFCRETVRRNIYDADEPAGRNSTHLHTLVFIMAAVIIGLVFNTVFPHEGNDFGNAGWNREESKAGQKQQAASAEIEDDFVLIEGGSFMMGSPESENWRIEDEKQHEVTVSSFYADPYETTQEDYDRLMGSNPSTFTGDRFSVENISWLEAVQYANAKSEEADLKPVYTITSGTVIWDLGANGYRLPTEAEWEYACRAGTKTPFNTEKSLDASEANFYGHYPYEIEENYFDDSALEAKPGEYRQTTVEVGSFAPNAWGLYDCHGNVNEWCWDYYGEYDNGKTIDPTGAEAGTRHVYRGGGWNDFAKNMRSAYRAAGQADMTSYNLGIRLVRNAGNERSGTVTAEGLTDTQTTGKILIAYFSWGGNTRGIAQEIQKQTGADIFEITLIEPYSTDYDTVLMEAQEDQHKQARPELAGHVENMENYDTILLGYPNWWASIPMPIASFLEEYDFTGKRIIPFCSHGGGRFGQSLTAIAKLAPQAVMGEGLSVHYSGGADLPDDISEWLAGNGIE